MWPCLILLQLHCAACKPDLMGPLTQSHCCSGLNIQAPRQKNKGETATINSAVFNTYTGRKHTHTHIHTELRALPQNPAERNIKSYKHLECQPWLWRGGEDGWSLASAAQAVMNDQIISRPHTHMRTHRHTCLDTHLYEQRLWLNKKKKKHTKKNTP